MIQITSRSHSPNYAFDACRFNRSAANGSRQSGYFGSLITQDKKGVPVSADELQTLRMVIQQIGAVNPSYHLVVYGDGEKPKHSEFLSAEALLKTLRTAVPDLDLSQHSLNPLSGGQGSIVFAGEIALGASQISALGLK